MLKHLLLPVLVLTACGSKTTSGQQTPIEWELRENESLAYRFVAEATPIVGGKERAAQSVMGYVLIDVGAGGQATVRFDAREPVFGFQPVELRPSSSNFFFPLPETAIGDEPLAQTFVVKGLGATTGRTNPDVLVSETLQRVSLEGSSARLRFTRKGRAMGDSRVELEFEEDGRGVFDLESGRYVQLERTAIMKMRADIGDAPTSMSLTVKYTMEFDADRSDARTEELARLRGPPVSADDLAKYMRAHSRQREIEKAVLLVENGQASVLSLFHLRANPLATWQAAMALPPARAEVFASAASFHLRRGRRLPQTVVDWFKRQLPKQPALATAVANAPDERLRTELVLLAAGGREQERIAKFARDSLRVIDAQKQGPTSLLAADEADFMQIGHALQADGRDHRALVPVLIQLLEKAPVAPAARFPLADVCVQWLEGITVRSLGKDVAAWKAFWAANEKKPYCRWMVEAAKQDAPLLVNNALSKLAWCGESREATSFLAAQLENSSGDTRQLAALSLAEHKDARAISALIDMLSSDQQSLRATALIALANFHSTTLGYSPDGDSASRALAVRRWRAWAKWHSQTP